MWAQKFCADLWRQILLFFWILTVGWNIDEYPYFLDLYGGVKYRGGKGSKNLYTSTVLDCVMEMKDCTDAICIWAATLDWPMYKSFENN